jgi:hypothetical protein
MSELSQALLGEDRILMRAENVLHPGRRRNHPHRLFL